MARHNRPKQGGHEHCEGTHDSHIRDYGVVGWSRVLRWTIGAIKTMEMRQLTMARNANDRSRNAQTLRGNVPWYCVRCWAFLLAENCNFANPLEY
ncbi:hypothetical protein V6N11_046142 [Hibiscus sabdariffa]|uniref:Uncharacterized protein n=2 Tax=Hibiscus sabdariffa TaxID=183260 RepID=A0ABR1ZEQ9_9ROSI